MFERDNFCILTANFFRLIAIYIIGSRIVAIAIFNKRNKMQVKILKNSIELLNFKMLYMYNNSNSNVIYIYIYLSLKINLLL